MPETTRITLDLSPELYRRLNAQADTAAAELELPRVTLAAVLRALISTANKSAMLDELRKSLTDQTGL